MIGATVCDIHAPRNVLKLLRLRHYLEGPLDEREPFAELLVHFTDGERELRGQYAPAPTAHLADMLDRSPSTSNLDHLMSANV